MQCEIILTGNELLIGKVVDTNGLWTIRQLTSLGVRVTHVSLIRDNLTEIAATIQAVLLRSPDYLFISGGLGPTYDDITLQGIQMALHHNIDVVLNAKAETWILERYQKRFPSLQIDELKEKYPYIKKMASMPKNARPLKNSAGTAPGAYIFSSYTNEKTIIVSMPGVPEEYERMFTEYILPDIQNVMKNMHFFECGFTFQNIPESGFANKIYQIKDNYPLFWFKTHPHRSPTKEWLIELHISCFSQDLSILSQMIEVYESLLLFVKKSGGTIISSRPPPKKENIMQPLKKLRN